MAADLPTGLWVEAKLYEFNALGVSYYVIQKGNHSSGLVMVKVNDRRGKCLLHMQQRNFMTNALEWSNALNDEVVEESNADEYISRAVQRDPDLWVIDIESEELKNPFIP